MWLDTHCHLDAAEFDPDRDAVVARARAAGVDGCVIPAVQVSDFERVAACAHRYGCAYALGIHPLAVVRADQHDLERLAVAARAALADPRFVGIGEIGLDYFVPDADADRERQQWFYVEQLKLARALALPVILHVRRSADQLLAQLRRIAVPGGIAHAFNGSEQQARQFVACGLRLGFGGAATYAGSRRIRRLAASLGADAFVLETDAPDILPQWLRAGGVARNEPAELARIAGEIAALRGTGLPQLAQQNRSNAYAALPRLQRALAA
jgi:TatD DNase family protein